MVSRWNGRDPNKTEPYMKTWHMLFFTQNTYAVFFINLCLPDVSFQRNGSAIK